MPTPAPWNRQSQEIQCSSPEGPLRCPVCGLQTDSLKRFDYVDWFVFVVVAAWLRASELVACPSCMRSLILRRCFRNILTANVAWPILVLPWAVYLWVAAGRPGHTLTPTSPAPGSEEEYQGVNWYRTFMVAAAAMSIIPCIGIVFALIALVMSRWAEGGARHVGPVAVLIAGLSTLLVVGVVLLGK